MNRHRWCSACRAASAWRPRVAPLGNPATNDPRNPTALGYPEVRWLARNPRVRPDATDCQGLLGGDDQIDSSRSLLPRQLGSPDGAETDSTWSKMASPHRDRAEKSIGRIRQTLRHLAETKIRKLIQLSEDHTFSFDLHQFQIFKFCLPLGGLTYLGDDRIQWTGRCYGHHQSLIDSRAPAGVSKFACQMDANAKVSKPLHEKSRCRRHCCVDRIDGKHTKWLIDVGLFGKHQQR